MFKKKPKARKVYSMAEIDELAASGKPVLVDFYQTGCAPCQVMDGIMNELSREYGTSAHVVKADIAGMPDALHKFKISRSARHQRWFSSQRHPPRNRRSPRTARQDHPAVIAR